MNRRPGNNTFFFIVGGTCVYAGITIPNTFTLWGGVAIIVITAMLALFDYRDLKWRTESARAVPASAYRLACGVCGHLVPSNGAVKAHRQLSDHLLNEHGVGNVDSGN